jgi:hypothetical protein
VQSAISGRGDREEMEVFDLANPGVKVVKSSFGGGWAFPITAEGATALRQYFGEGPTPLAPFGGEEGYIVEPWQSGDIAECLRAVGVAWRVE